MNGVGNGVGDGVEDASEHGVRERKEEVDRDTPFDLRIHTRLGPASKEHSIETTSGSEGPSTLAEGS